jgi:hypothetical protein
MMVCVKNTQLNFIPCLFIKVVVVFQGELEALRGMKCQAPHKHHWGDVSYHNALVCGAELTSSIHSMDQIQVHAFPGRF